MNLQEIINRSDSEEFAEKELIYVVESYIEDKLGVKVIINLSRGFERVPRFFAEKFYSRQIVRLNEVFSVARDHFKNKNNETSDISNSSDI